jgi:hypothetical protein
MFQLTHHISGNIHRNNSHNYSLEVNGECGKIKNW